jgi:hypothetical protein
MIKMLGLLKEDMSSSQNEWAWFGYQVNRLSELESFETKLFSLFSDDALNASFLITSYDAFCKFVLAGCTTFVN